LNDVLSILAVGAEQERNGNLEAAAQSYRKAVRLDPLSEPAQKALRRVDARSVDNAFTRAMSEAVAALNRGDFEAAREALGRANAIKPGSPQVADGLAQAEEGLRLERIARHREKALAFEKTEVWRSAAGEYHAVLELDSTITFARDVKARCTERAELSDRLEFHIGNPSRLSDENVLREASLLLGTARSIEPAGPKLRQQTKVLGDLIEKASTPVPVELISDDLTEVVVYRVGRLGTFSRHLLDLRPGTYTVVGTRRGFRDVRLKLVIVAGKVPEPLVVRCEEKI
jgi:tetratricopeptide (TPR) repeat protein